MTLSVNDPHIHLKQRAAVKAADFVENNMVVGLGTGSTANCLIDELGRRVKNGLKISAIASSKQSARRAKEVGIELTTFSQHPNLDIGIDGADQITSYHLNLVKGLGGALLWEKIVAQACNTFIVMADTRKLVEHLGEKTPVPVEIVPFGWERTQKQIQALSGNTSIRKREDGQFFLTDEHNLIIDCLFGTITQPEKLASQLKAITGVIEHGLFLGMAKYAIIASQEGTKLLKNPL